MLIGQRHLVIVHVCESTVTKLGQPESMAYDLRSYRRAAPDVQCDCGQAWQLGVLIACYYASFQKNGMKSHRNNVERQSGSPAHRIHGETPAYFEEELAYMCGSFSSPCGHYPGDQNNFIIAIVEPTKQCYFSPNEYAAIGVCSHSFIVET